MHIHKSKCKQHGILSNKRTITKKVWAKKRDGTFGYQFKKAVKYECKIGKSIPVNTRESELNHSRESQCGKVDYSESGSSEMFDRFSGGGIRRGAANNNRSESGLDFEPGLESSTRPTD